MHLWERGKLMRIEIERRSSQIKHHNAFGMKMKNVEVFRLLYGRFFISYRSLSFMWTELKHQNGEHLYMLFTVIKSVFICRVYSLIICKTSRYRTYAMCARVRRKCDGSRTSVKSYWAGLYTSRVPFAYFGIISQWLAKKNRNRELQMKKETEMELNVHGAYFGTSNLGSLTSARGPRSLVLRVRLIESTKDDSSKFSYVLCFCCC